MHYFRADDEEMILLTAAIERASELRHQELKTLIDAVGVSVGNAVAKAMGGR